MTFSLRKFCGGGIYWEGIKRSLGKDPLVQVICFPFLVMGIINSIEKKS